jgi:hypothetical protein
MPPSTATKPSARHTNARAPRPRQASSEASGAGASPSGRPSPARGVSKLIPFAAIDQPGAYVSMWDGLLLRVPPRAIRSGGSPVLDLVSSKPLFVTKISDDPFVVVTKARLLAGNLDVATQF